MTYNVDKIKESLNNQGIPGEGRTFLFGAINENDNTAYVATMGSDEKYWKNGVFDNDSAQKSVEFYLGKEKFEKMNVVGVEGALGVEGVYPITIVYKEPDSVSQNTITYNGPGAVTDLFCVSELLELKSL
ncbi:MAG: hypothetical protein ABIG84_04705 [archaeon]